MESLKGDFSEHIRHAYKDDIQHIEDFCELFKKGKYKYTGEEELSKWTDKDRKSDLIFLKQIKKNLKDLGIQMCQ